MRKLKLMTIVGTRPEIIRLSEVLRRADDYFEHTLVHTGQNYDYELNQVFFEELALRRPDYFLQAAGGHLGETMGNIIAKSFALMAEAKPDALLVLGDTNSALSAISAKRLKVPIFHMEAGNRCWDWNVSEMVNRKIVDHISDVNLPYTENARRYLLGEGLDGKTLFVTGSPMAEVLAAHRERIEESDVAHREENIDNEANFLSLMGAVNRIAERRGLPIVYSCHPRSKKMIEKRGFVFHPLVQSLPPFGFLDYNKLQTSAYCVLSDSGTLSEESALLGFAGVLVRTSTERPEALDAGSVVVGGITGDDVEQAMDLAVSMRENGERTALPADYQALNVSAKVIKIIQSYAKIVDETVWLKR